MEIVIDVTSDLLSQAPARLAGSFGAATPQQTFYQSVFRPGVFANVALPATPFPALPIPGIPGSQMTGEDDGDSEGLAVAAAPEVQPQAAVFAQPTLAERQVATLQQHLCAVQVFLLRTMALGLEDFFSRQEDAGRDYLWHRRLMADLAALDQAMALLRAGAILDAGSLRLHVTRDYVVRIEDLVELEIVSAAAGSWSSRIAAKFKSLGSEFAEADLKDQASILSNSVVVLGAGYAAIHAAVLGLNIWLADPEPEVDPGGTGQIEEQLGADDQRSIQLALNIPLGEAANALLLEELSQKRAPLYDPGQGGTRDLQSALTRLGFDPGGVDGRRGTKTRAAETAAAEAWSLSGLSAEDPTFRLRLAREILLLEAAGKMETGLG